MYHLSSDAKLSTQNSIPSGLQINSMPYIPDSTKNITFKSKSPMRLPPSLTTYGQSSATETISLTSSRSRPSIQMFKNSSPVVQQNILVQSVALNKSQLVIPGTPVLIGQPATSILQTSYAHPVSTLQLLPQHSYVQPVTTIQVQQQPSYVQPVLVQVQQCHSYVQPVATVQVQQQLVQTTQTVLQEKIIQCVAAQPQPTKVITRPLQVVDLRQFEVQWLQRIAELEANQKVEDRVVIQVEEREVIKVEEKIVFKEDTSRVSQFEFQIQKLKTTVDEYKIALIERDNNIRLQEGEIEGYKRQLRQIPQLQTDLNNSHQQIDEFRLRTNILVTEKRTLTDQLAHKDSELNLYRQEILRLKEECHFFTENLSVKEQDINDKQREIDDLMNENDDLKETMTTTETQTSYLSSEINTWKNKFIDLNKNFHSINEQYMLCQAELENLQKGQSKMTTVSTEVTRNQVRRSSINSKGRQSSTERGSYKE